MIIPKIFNGRNKLFFFFSFDGFDDRKTTENTFNHTLPTLQERQGNFSDLLAVNAAKYQLYDPLSVRADPSRPGHYLRDPIPGNILPTNRIINPAYQTYLSSCRFRTILRPPALWSRSTTIWIPPSLTTGFTARLPTASTTHCRRSTVSSGAGRG